MGWTLFLVIETLTQIVFKIAGATLDGQAGFPAMAAKALTTPAVLGGFALYFIGFLIWMTILKDVDLGHAYPLTSLIYVTTVIAAIALFHERLNLIRVLGVTTIIAGVVLISSGDQHHANPSASRARGGASSP